MNIGDLVTLEEMEREHIIQVLQKTPDLGTAARVLGIDPATLYRKRKRLGLGRQGQASDHPDQAPPAPPEEAMAEMAENGRGT